MTVPPSRVFCHPAMKTKVDVVIPAILELTSDNWACQAVKLDGYAQLFNTYTLVSFTPMADYT